MSELKIYKKIIWLDFANLGPNVVVFLSKNESKTSVQPLEKCCFALLFCLLCFPLHFLFCFCVCFCFLVFCFPTAFVFLFVYFIYFCIPLL